MDWTPENKNRWVAVRRPSLDAMADKLAEVAEMRIGISSLKCDSLNYGETVIIEFTSTSPNVDANFCMYDMVHASEVSTYTLTPAAVTWTKSYNHASAYGLYDHTVHAILKSATILDR